MADADVAEDEAEPWQLPEGLRWSMHMPTGHRPRWSISATATQKFDLRDLSTLPKTLCIDPVQGVIGLLRDREDAGALAELIEARNRTAPPTAEEWNAACGSLTQFHVDDEDPPT